jgi:hypothetical protein
MAESMIWNAAPSSISRPKVAPPKLIRLIGMFVFPKILFSTALSSGYSLRSFFLRGPIERRNHLQHVQPFCASNGRSPLVANAINRSLDKWRVTPGTWIVGK